MYRLNANYPLTNVQSRTLKHGASMGPEKLRTCPLDSVVRIFCELGNLEICCSFFFLANPLIHSLSTLLICVSFIRGVLRFDPDRGNSVLAGVLRIP